MKVEIQGGHSGIGEITIFSDRFSATAHFDEETRRIKCEVEPIPRLVSFVERMSDFPIPRILIFAARLAVSLRKRHFLYLAIIIFIWLFPSFRHAENQIPEPVSREWIWVAWAVIVSTLVLGAFLSFVSTRLCAPWHGAEHMAIAAYDQYGALCIKKIRKESPINKECGTRFFLPAFIILCMPYLVSWEHVWVYQIVLAEGILWFDKLIGLEKLPIVSHFSYFLQKYLTTSRPQRHQIRTAQRALYDLVTAHQSAT